jgi:hypothetical protein
MRSRHHADAPPKTNPSHAGGATPMNDSRITDELAGLRAFLKRLENTELRLVRNGVDVSNDEIEVLKREIAHLEAVLKPHPQP